MLKGICIFFSENDDGSGSWAFKDGEFISKNTPGSTCKKCGRYLEMENPPRCINGEHERKTYNMWSEGDIHVLQDGDHLAIYSLEDESVLLWQGRITLEKCPFFLKTIFGVRVSGCQQDVDSRIWARYFLSRYPAELTKKDDS